MASNLAREFTTLFKERRGEDLAEWIQRASDEAVPVDFRRFAQDLMIDRAAVQAAATLRWSYGQTEGQINRLKLTKREMYGRAKLDLLRKRFTFKSGVG
jgi:transposase